MKHQVPGLHGATPFPHGFFLVRIAFAQYRGQKKPFLALVLSDPRYAVLRFALAGAVAARFLRSLPGWMSTSAGI